MARQTRSHGATGNYGVSIIGSFNRYFGNLDQLVSNVLEPLTDDLCEVGSNSSKSIRNRASNFKLIDAGDSIFVRGENGTLIDVIRYPESEGNQYYVDQAISAVSELGTLDVPGDEFPAATEIAIPETEAFIFPSHQQGDVVTADSEFNWLPSELNDDYVVITLKTEGGNGDIGWISCEAVDDGTLSLPDEIKSVVNSSARVSLIIATRYRTFVDTQGIVAISTTVSRFAE